MTSIDEIRIITSFLSFTDLPNLAAVSKDFNQIISEKLEPIKNAVDKADDAVKQFMCSDRVNTDYYRTDVAIEGEKIVVRKFFYSVYVNHSDEKKLVPKNFGIIVRPDRINRLSDIGAYEYRFKKIKKDCGKMITNEFYTRCVVNGIPDNLKELLDNEINNH